MDIVHHRARSIGILRGVNRATRKSVEQKTVNRAKTHLAVFGAPAQSFDMVEQPDHLGRGKIGVDHQPRPVFNQTFQTVGAVARTQIRRAPALPHNGVVHGLARGAIPNHRRFPLVRNANACNAFRIDIRIFDRRANNM